MWRVILGLAVGCSYTPKSAGETPPSDGDTADSGGDGMPPDMALPDPDGPAQLAIVTNGLVEDLDADVGVTGTASVTVWENQVNAGEDRVVSVGGLGPIALISNAVNGHAALDFNNNARLEGDNAAVFADLTNGVGLTWFAVVESAPAQDNAERNQIFGWIRNNGINSGITAGFDQTARPYAMIRPAGTEFKAQSTTSISQWTILAGRLAEGGSANVQLFCDSGAPVATATTTAANSPVGALTIGAERDDGTEFFDGRIARILIYARTLDDNELKQTGRALGQRYAIVNAF